MITKKVLAALDNAVTINQYEEDGALYLQKVCTITELKELKKHTKRSKDADQIIDDAITYKRVLNKRKA